MEAIDQLEFDIQENMDDELVKEALLKGIDLREYSREIETKLNEVEQSSISDYMKEGSNIASLHRQIVDCDSVLERMESMLEGFQLHLGNISSEIHSLQQQSLAMNVKLKNRQAVRGELSQFIDEMIVSESMIDHILETKVTEREFLEQLQELNQKINFVKEQSFKETRSIHDVASVIEKLKFKAVAKIREFCLTKINQFKKPMANYQITQNLLLKFKFYFEFIACQAPPIAREIRDDYIDTMSKVYFSYFKAYTSKLMRLQVERVTSRDNLLGVDDSNKNKGFFSKPSTKQKSSTFTLGERGACLTADLESPAIVPHTASKDDRKFSYEQLFRSLQFTLLDSCCREYLFIAEFFMLSGGAAVEMFNAILGKTLEVTLKEVDLHAKETYDALSLFICIQIIHRYNAIALERKVPILQRYFDALLSLLQPRFEFVFYQHIHSVQACDISKLGQVDLQPHFISRRYAELCAAVVALNEGHENDQAVRLLAQLELEMQTWLLKMAAEFSHRKDQLVFLLNNYDMIISVVSEHTSSDSEHMNAFKALLTSRTEEYIDEVLSPYFGGIMAFVKEAELRLDQGSASDYGQHEAKISQLIRGFNADWKKAIDNINRDIMRSFTNFKAGTQILQASLTQLIQFYHRFQKVMSQPPFRNWPIKNELINIHNIMVEVKKHKFNF